MPHPSHRLDLILLPAEPWVEDCLDRLWAAWCDQGYIDEQGKPGANAARLVAGGFARVRRDRPGRPHLYGNQQGGFRAMCPHCNGGMAGQLTEQAVDRDRVRCPTCDASMGVNALVFRPEAVRSRGAMVVADAESARLTEPAWSEVVRIWGDARLIWRRG